MINTIKINEAESLRTQLAEAQAWEKELRSKAQAAIDDTACGNPMIQENWEPLYWELHIALSRPSDYSALNEALARECERLADFAKSKSDLGSWWDMFETWLRTEASKHRGQK